MSRSLESTAERQSKLNGAQLRELIIPAKLPKSAVDGCNTVSEAVAILEGKALLAEALRLVAHALPKREAVWWACMCAAHTESTEVSQIDRAARDAAEQWVRRPSEASRRAAMSSAKAAAFATPEAWAAVGAFWSGGSIAEAENKPAVVPSPHLTGSAVAGSLALASVRGDPARRIERIRRFLESAHDIAIGGSGRLTS
jgi:hypothetical protein